MLSRPHVRTLVVQAISFALLVATAVSVVRAQTAVTDASRLEIIKGRITTEHDLPLRKAIVIATMAPDRLVFTDTTDENGAFHITVMNGRGDYLVFVSAIGHKSMRKRITSISNDSVFIVNLQLVPSVAQLKAIQVAARKPLPFRGTASGVETGAAERVPDALIGSVSPDQEGDVNALAVMLPGASLTAGGYSVLGLGSAQNSATVNGMNFAGAGLPRDISTTARVSTSTYDPARGWFSGANVNIELGGGGLFGSARAHATIDAPPMQMTDAISTSAGQRFSNVRASFGADAPLTWENKYFYNAGAQVDRRTSDIASILNANSQLLSKVGVSSDSTARLLDALRSARVPITALALPTMRTSENGLFMARFERTGMNWATFKPVPVTYGLLAFGQVSRDRATNVSILGTPGRAGETTQHSAGLQGVYSRFFHTDYLNETRSTLSATGRRETALLAIPEGRVAVQSSLNDNEDQFATLLFGGNSQGNRQSQTLTWETVNTIKFYAQGKSAHAVKLTSDVRFDSYRSSRSNSLGVFNYQSLADVSNNTPTSYSRSLLSPVRTGGEWNAFAAIGDSWRVSPRLQLMYGARFEGNAFTSRAAFNPAVLNTFGAHTDYAPNTLHVSPRFGFTWLHMSERNTTTRRGPLGTYALVTPRYLRGGIGEFRGMMSPSLLSDARAATGLSGGEDSFSCIGTATPVPDWFAYSTNQLNIPRTCGGSAASTLGDSARNIRLVANGFRPPSSWRANLAYATRTSVVDWSVEGVYSLNLHQPGTSDLNFRGVPSFALADDGRPVFVSAGSIVQSNGAVSPVEARTSAAFGRVASAGSDLRSVSRQLTFSARPSPDIMRDWFVTAAYTLSNTRAEARGFDATTGGSPAERGWARGNLDARHQVLAQAGIRWRGLTIGGLTRLRSGLPFTPMVSGDINGDGLANDRAFVANPATNAVAASDLALQNLLRGSNAASSCLLSQLGRIAARNSCEGPWTVMLNAFLSVSNETLRAHRVTNISINFSNPLSGIDQLVHGSSNLHGWGSSNTPDGVLYFVRDFNAASRRFQYNVNPRFGSALGSNVVGRAPFRVTLDVGVDLGKPVPVQQLNQWLKPGRAGNSAPRLGVSDLKKRYERNVPDPFRMVLQDSDSLLVNRAQLEALTRAQPAYRAKMDSLWTALATDMAALGDHYNDAAALRRQEAAIDQGWEITRIAVRAFVAPVLNTVQLGLLPGWVAALYRTDKATQYRMYLAGPSN
ncbi:MAG: carboxypeptidase regulatory-like domain-containing protein [Gemmatimonadota bacterium]|nr:carboxypeptidase regulatory-like domain-containing protein [Gemmatimonadota bacterium]